jgi:acetyltransferase-like isoleucine patch superfamily enzyme
VAHYSSILDHDYDIHSDGNYFDTHKVSTPIIIGEGVWLGAYSLILKGVTIGDHSVIGAQTMVRKSVPERMLVYCHSNSQLTFKELGCGSVE